MISSIFDMLGDADLDEDGMDALLDMIHDTECWQTRQAASLEMHNALLADYQNLSFPQPPPFVGIWELTKDGDPHAYQMFLRHYSAVKRKRKVRLFVGPGEKLVLVTRNYDALFAWRVSRYRNDNQHGVECTIFRNESARLSSEMILSAECHAMQKWPTAFRFFTYVNADRVASSNAGYCFIKAGWKKIGMSANGLILFEKLTDHWYEWLYDSVLRTA